MEAHYDVIILYAVTGILFGEFAVAAQRRPEAIPHGLPDWGLWLLCFAIWPVVLLLMTAFAKRQKRSKGPWG